MGQSLSLRVKISSHGQSLSQDFFCLQEMESKKKGCFITKKEALNVIAKSNRLGESIPGMLMVVMTKALTT